MSEEFRPLEGWQVRGRPAAIGMAAVLLTLIVMLVGLGHWYNLRFAPRTRPKLALAAEPRLETAQRPPGERIGAGPPRPRNIAAATRSIVAEGDALWGAARPERRP